MEPKNRRFKFSRPERAKGFRWRNFALSQQHKCSRKRALPPHVAMRRAGLFVGVSCFVVVALALARPRAARRGGARRPGGGAGRRRRAPEVVRGRCRQARPSAPSAPAGGRLGLDPGGVSRARRELELATLRRLDPELFSNLPPEAGAWDPRSRNPCFRDRRDPSSLRCRFYHVVGAWQSGTRAFNAELAAARRSVHLAPETHFWNEDKPVRAEYLPRFDACAASSPIDAPRSLRKTRLFYT